MIRPVFLLLAVSLALSSPSAAQRATNHDGPLSDRIVSYSINARLDPETRTVKGTQRLTWRNPGSTPVDELQFHLYLNAFKPGSTFQVESGGVHRGFAAADDDRWGGITVNRMQVASSLPADLGTALPYSGPGEDLTDRIRFIQPDDGNVNDQTVISVPLSTPVGPGETIALDIDFDSVLPRITARTGFTEDSDGRPFFMVAQWFPKIGVYEVPGQRYVPADAPTGAWNTHQFHANSEFYADFGTYDVNIDVPATYVVGASGVQNDDTASGDRREISFRAEDVHDFAWTAYEGYEEFTRTWRHVNIRALIRPEHTAQGERHLDAAVVALERYDDWVGEYPYTTLTLVDGIGGSNGMEYPTLITCGTAYMLPSWVRVMEMVTIHEFGHQYFYGLLASNEFEEAWLDEGMNSYVESRILDDAYGPGSVMDLPGAPIGDKAMQRLSYTKNTPGRGALFAKAWDYKFGDYGKASYSKPATIMNTLEAYLGWDTMRTFLRTYYERWRFRHPTTRDLQDVAEEVSGQDLDWFFDQFVYGTVAVDYEITEVANQPADAPASADSTTNWYISRITVHRAENGHFPTSIRATFSDGTTEDIAWDGKDEWRRFTLEARPARLVEAYLDPDGKLWLETQRLNNRKTLEPSRTAARRELGKFTTRFQQILTILSSLF